jgi:Skp family chaperone for outer membrane proteins
MKTLLRSTLLLIALAGTAPALAETLPPPRIAVVDLDDLSRKSLVTHDLEKKVNAAKETFRQTSKYRFEGLQDELRQLRIDAANMSEEERTQRQNSLEERITQAAEEQKQGLDAIDARGQAAMDSLQVKLQAIVRRVAEGMTLDIVMDKKAYEELVAGKLAAPGANDITGLVATFLNAEVPTVELPAQGAKP